MTQPRFRPRYAIENQTLEGLYDVFDYEDGCVVSDKPAPHAVAKRDAQLRNAVAENADTGIAAWLPALNLANDIAFTPVIFTDADTP